jgi:rod shape determining protein RodA
MRALTLGERLRQADWLLLGLGVALAVGGVIAIEIAAGGRVDHGAIQSRWLVIGIAVCLLMLAVPYRGVVTWRYLWYAGGIALLLMVLLFGSGKSARRWIALGSFRMQPSEVMKLILVITLAGYIRYERSHRTFRGLATPFGLTLIPLLLIMKQPDLGTAMLLVPILFVMLYVAGANRLHLSIVAGAGMAAASTRRTASARSCSRATRTRRCYASRTTRSSTARWWWGGRASSAAAQGMRPARPSGSCPSATPTSSFPS